MPLMVIRVGHGLNNSQLAGRRPDGQPRPGFQKARPSVAAGWLACPRAGRRRPEPHDVTCAGRSTGHVFDVLAVAVVLRQDLSARLLAGRTQCRKLIGWRTR